LFYRLFLTALIAGLAAGVVLAGAQVLRTIPLIHQAEVYESAAQKTAPQNGTQAESPPPAAHQHHGESAWQPKAGLERYALTLLADLLVAIGFALLLVGGYAWFGAPTWREGILWGLGGFVAFTLAPSLGLPPELPGTSTAALPLRQMWWIGTAVGTAAGLLLIAFAGRLPWKALGVVFITLPHLIGAPQPEYREMAAPVGLSQQFVIASLAANLIFWLVLGPLTAWLYGRLVRPAAPHA
jgi:cobalt transporter subunit CbtA